MGHKIHKLWIYMLLFQLKSIDVIIWFWFHYRF